MKRAMAVLITVMLLFSTYVFAESEFWVCSKCGSEATRNFCSNCGAEKPLEEWICPNCGNNAKGNFCGYCGTPHNRTNSDAEYETSVSQNNTTDASNILEEEKETDSAEKSLKEPTILEGYPIKNTLTSFSEGYAWVTYEDEDYNEEYYCVIDKNGYIIWSISAFELIGWSNIRITDFSKGTSCIYAGTDYSGPMIFGPNVPGLIIVNTDGETVFSSLEIDSSYEYMGSGDGNYLIMEHVANFDVNQTKVLSVDSSGNLSFLFVKEDDLAYADSFQYLGNGIYWGGQYRDILYNFNTNQLFSVGVPYGIEFYDKSVYNKVLVNERGRYYVINSSYFQNETSWSQLLDGSSLNTDYAVSTYAAIDQQCISEGLVNCTLSGSYPGVEVERGIYTYEGDLVSNVNYPSDWDIIDADGFSGGYAALNLKGKDGNSYITVIDSSGTPQYQPTKVDSCFFPAWHGYVSAEIGGYQVILSPSGDITDRIELDKISLDYHIGSIEVSDGYERYADHYEGSEDAYLDWVYYVTYNDVDLYSENDYYDEELYYESESKYYNNDSYDELETDFQDYQKEYINVSNFIIEGKWKNIGEETVGQIQAGSIVAFDGKNCNVYSPADTYAFYKNGENYRLDCTSMLFSDTLSFTVKIVDDNHIDLYTGGRYIELERVG